MHGSFRGKRTELGLATNMGGRTTETPEMDETQAHESVDRVLAEYMLRVDRGEPVNRKTIMAAHPEEAERLRAYFANEDAIQAMVSPPNSATEAWTPPSCAHDTAAPGNPGQVESPPPLAPGYCVAGRYEIRRLLGRGGMGAVYRQAKNRYQRTSCW